MENASKKAQNIVYTNDKGMGSDSLAVLPLTRYVILSLSELPFFSVKTLIKMYAMIRDYACESLSAEFRCGMGSINSIKHKLLGLPLYAILIEFITPKSIIQVQ